MLFDLHHSQQQLIQVIGEFIDDIEVLHLYLEAIRLFLEDGIEGDIESEKQRS